MKQTLIKNLVCLAMMVLIIAPVFIFNALPAQAEVNLGTDYASNIGLGNRDPRDIASSIIKVVLGFLAIVAVVIILLGGFKWMTAGGNEEKVSEARKLIVAGIIGLIILAAWGIANFVLSSLLNATNSA